MAIAFHAFPMAHFGVSEQKNTDFAKWSEIERVIID